MGDRRDSFAKNLLASAVFFVIAGLAAIRVAFTRRYATLIAVGGANIFSVFLARFVSRLVRISALAAVTSTFTRGAGNTFVAIFRVFTIGFFIAHADIIADRKSGMTGLAFRSGAVDLRKTKSIKILMKF